MKRVLSLLFGLAIAFSIGLTSVAHAAEPNGSFTLSAATSSLVMVDHSQNDGDQVPADGDKDYPHHHGGCHGHHELASLDRTVWTNGHTLPIKLRPGVARHLSESLSEPGLRPPQA